MAADNNNDSGSYLQLAARDRLNAKLFTTGCMAYHPVAPGGAVHTTLMARGDLNSGSHNTWTLGPSQISATTRFAVRAPSNTQFNAFGPTPPATVWYSLIGRVNGRTVDLLYDGQVVGSTAMTEVLGTTTQSLRFFQRTDGLHHGDTILAHCWFIDTPLTNAECARIAEGEDPRVVRPGNVVFFHSLNSIGPIPDYGPHFTAAGSQMLSFPGPALKPTPSIVPRLYAAVPQGSPSTNNRWWWAAAHSLAA